MRAQKTPKAYVMQKHMLPHPRQVQDQKGVAELT